MCSYSKKDAINEDERAIDLTEEILRTTKDGFTTIWRNNNSQENLIYLQ